jgi:hypothetical protein
MGDLVMRCVGTRCAVRSDRGDPVAEIVIQSADKGVSQWMSPTCGPVKRSVVGR